MLAEGWRYRAAAGRARTDGWRHGRGRAGLLLAVALSTTLTGACVAGLPEPDGPQPYSTSFRTWRATTVGVDVAPLVDARDGQSGFSLIGDGESAFNLRHQLTVLADQTVDAQYYIWEGDTSGRLLANDLVRAARRGVRVRLLIDDIHTGGRDFSIAALADHPNIEIRVFNPFANRRARNLNLLFDLVRLNHRMHNKAWIVDGAVAIVGGRNIGDDYFGINTVSNFRDLDVLAVGPVARDVAASFDLYWNSEWALPIATMASKVPSPDQAADIRGRLSRWAVEQTGFPYPLDHDREAAAAGLRAVWRDLIWADARTVYDPPDKPAGTAESPVMSALWPVIENAERDVLIEASYFIATDDGVEALTGMAKRGVRTRILTNSLATNDLIPAHAGYSRYRAALLRGGVEIYEFRPDATGPRTGWSGLAGESRASLHSKTMVVDDATVFIGSFNPTPRSVEFNTEIGILIESPHLAGQVRAFIEGAMDGHNAWRLVLAGEGDRLRWTAEVDGRTITLTKEPEVGRWRRFTAWFVSLLPIERIL